MSFRLIFLATLALALVNGACSEDTSTSPSGGVGAGSGPGYASTERSPTCLEWQDALCDWSADKCGQSARAACDDTAQSLYCKSDATMQSCIDALAFAPCSSKAPVACQGVADAAPAKIACQNFIDRYCDHLVGCDVSDRATCLSASASGLDCDKAVGASPSLDACLSSLSSLKCPPAGESPVLPSTCKGVIKLQSFDPLADAPPWSLEIVSVVPSLLVE